MVSKALRVFEILDVTDSDWELAISESLPVGLLKYLQNLTCDEDSSVGTPWHFL